MPSIIALQYYAIEEVLTSLGGPTSKALIRQLNHDGIAFSKDGIDVTRFESKIRQFFGSASDVIIEKIHSRFMGMIVEAGGFRLLGTSKSIGHKDENSPEVAHHRNKTAS